MNDAHKGITDYNSLGKWIISTPVPKNPPNDGEFRSIVWIDEHQIQNPDGEIINVSRHLREYHTVQSYYDGEEGGVRRERVEFHRNFEIDGVEAEYCGRTKTMELEIFDTTSTGYAQKPTGQKFWLDKVKGLVLTYRIAPESAKATQKLVFADEKRADNDIPIPGTGKYLHFADPAPYVPKAKTVDTE